MYILNEYSIDSQFEDFEAFLDSLFEHTIPLFQLMDKYNLDLVKGYETYNLKLTEKLSIYDLLYSSGGSYPEIIKFKSLLNKRLSDDPYWCEKDPNHNCFKEALEKKVGLISFEHNKYLEDKLEYTDEGVLHIIANSYNETQLLEELKDKAIVGVGEYLEAKFPIIENFCNLNGKNYFEDFIKKADIKQDEINKILEDISDFINRYLNNQPLGRLSSTIESNLYEFRTTIADSKEVRILYCLKDQSFIFLNCFIKKQAKTPDNEKSLGKSLRDVFL